MEISGNRLISIVKKKHLQRTMGLSNKFQAGFLMYSSMGRTISTMDYGCALDHGNAITIMVS